ncbi:MAG: hypothetical protein HY326_02200 [Chloroflexi bacterium]|nr:hypothetical protein [Chloroflexota bacterium]
MNWSELVRGLLVVAGVALILAVLLGVWVWRSVKRLRLPEDATFVEAMQVTPFSVVLLLDLLDLALDIFSAPVSWTILSKLGLRPLRGVTVIEALIPGTQVLPTMTLAWVLVRLFASRLENGRVIG